MTHFDASTAPVLWLFTVLLFGARRRSARRRAASAQRGCRRWSSGSRASCRIPCSSRQAVVLSADVLDLDRLLARRRILGRSRMPRLGLRASVWSYLYSGAMVVRYVIRMARRPDQRWLGGTIPIIFHSVVAAFQWTFGHVSRTRLS